MCFGNLNAVVVLPAKREVPVALGYSIEKWLEAALNLGIKISFSTFLGFADVSKLVLEVDFGAADLVLVGD